MRLRFAPALCAGPSARGPAGVRQAIRRAAGVSDDFRLGTPLNAIGQSLAATQPEWRIWMVRSPRHRVSYSAQQMADRDSGLGWCSALR
jgi:hypothetical protein